jgi:hypothetical protein
MEDTEAKIKEFRIKGCGNSLKNYYDRLMRGLVKSGCHIGH